MVSYNHLGDDGFGVDATTRLTTLSRAVVPALQVASVIMAVAIAYAIGLCLVRSMTMDVGGDEGAQHIDKPLFFRTEMKSFKCFDVFARGNSDAPHAHRIACIGVCLLRCVLYVSRPRVKAIAIGLPRPTLLKFRRQVAEHRSLRWHLCLLCACGG